MSALHLASCMSVTHAQVCRMAVTHAQSSRVNVSVTHARLCCIPVTHAQLHLRSAGAWSDVVLPRNTRVLVSACSLAGIAGLRSITIPPSSELIIDNADVLVKVGVIYVQVSEQTPVV